MDAVTVTALCLLFAAVGFIGGMIYKERQGRTVAKIRREIEGVASELFEEERK